MLKNICVATEKIVDGIKSACVAVDLRCTLCSVVLFPVTSATVTTTDRDTLIVRCKRETSATFTSLV